MSSIMGIWDVFYKTKYEKIFMYSSIKGFEGYGVPQITGGMEEDKYPLKQKIYREEENLCDTNVE